jgi:hypothetical protein
VVAEAAVLGRIRNGGTGGGGGGAGSGGFGRAGGGGGGGSGTTADPPERPPGRSRRCRAGSATELGDVETGPT